MFSTKSRYALRILIDLAQQKSDDFIPLKDIAERQDISKKYLEIIAKDLVKGGLEILEFYSKAVPNYSKSVQLFDCWQITHHFVELLVSAHILQ